VRPVANTTLPVENSLDGVFAAVECLWWIQIEANSGFGRPRSATSDCRFAFFNGLHRFCGNLWGIVVANVVPDFTICKPVARSNSWLVCRPLEFEATCAASLGVWRPSVCWQ
jgi:hypothetical protein